jgi:hypothetical protein
MISLQCLILEGARRFREGLFRKYWMIRRSAMTGEVPVAPARNIGQSLHSIAHIRLLAKGRSD